MASGILNMVYINLKANILLNCHFIVTYTELGEKAIMMFKVNKFLINKEKSTVFDAFYEISETSEIRE